MNILKNILFFSLIFSTCIIPKVFSKNIDDDILLDEDYVKELKNIFDNDGIYPTDNDYDDLSDKDLFKLILGHDIDDNAKENIYNEFEKILSKKIGYNDKNFKNQINKLFLKLDSAYKEYSNVHERLTRPAVIIYGSKFIVVKPMNNVRDKFDILHDLSFNITEYIENNTKFFNNWNKNKFDIKIFNVLFKYFNFSNQYSIYMKDFIKAIKKNKYINDKNNEDVKEFIELKVKMSKIEETVKIINRNRNEIIKIFNNFLNDEKNIKSLEKITNVEFVNYVKNEFYNLTN